MVEYKHQRVGIGFPVYCTDRDASAVRMMLFASEQMLRNDMNLMVFGPRSVTYTFHKPSPQFAWNPAELRWMADIAAGDDAWGS